MLSNTLAKSRFWSSLWKYYSSAPSVVFCRVPELEYASRLDVSSCVLDHCCGDGILASLAWPEQKLCAGCDISEVRIASARRKGLYSRLEVCDVSRPTPFHSNSFDLIFNNSALEHIPDLDATLSEVRRLLKPGGKFAFNLLNHRYFEWWPLGEVAKKVYREWQPFYHALPIDEWGARLERSGMMLISYEGYFDEDAARMLGYLDYVFSAYYLRKRQSAIVLATRNLGFLAKIYWKRRLAKYRWQTEPDNGAGYFIIARRVD